MAFFFFVIIIIGVGQGLCRVFDAPWQKHICPGACAMRLCDSPRGVLPYMGYILGMCRCGGYDCQEVHSRIGFINQSVWV